MADDLTRETVDMEDRLSDLRQQLEDVRDEASDVRQGSEKGEQLEQVYGSIRAEIRQFENYLEKWGDGRFVIKEMTFGELMRAKDEVQEASFEMNRQSGDIEGIPRDGFYRITALRLAIDDMPENAPDDPKAFPKYIGQWLYDAIDNLNTFGEVDTGNSSLWDETNSGSSEQNSSDAGSTQTQSN